MNITCVRIEDPPYKEDCKVLAFVSITVDDCFAVHGLKILQMADGRTIVAMPNYKHRVSCDDCHTRVSVFDCYCHRCGKRLPERSAQLSKAKVGENQKPRLFHDVCHPTDPDTRKLIESRVLAAWREWREGHAHREGQS